MSQTSFSFGPARLLIYTAAVAVAIGSYLVFDALPALLEKRVYTYELHYTFHGEDAKELWTYFSEFGNLMKANPTLIDYKILHSTSTAVAGKKEAEKEDENENSSTSDKTSGQVANLSTSENETDACQDKTLKYSVAYTETLVRIPFLTNSGIANFSIGVGVGEGAAVGAETAIYWINSTHVTYQNGGAFYSNDTMAFIPGSRPSPESESALSQSPAVALTILRQTIAIECPLLLAPFCKYEFTGQRALILQELSREFVFTVKIELIEPSI